MRSITKAIQLFKFNLPPFLIYHRHLYSGRFLCNVHARTLNHAIRMALFRFMEKATPTVSIKGK